MDTKTTTNAAPAGPLPASDNDAPVKIITESLSEKVVEEEGVLATPSLAAVTPEQPDKAHPANHQNGISEKLKDTIAVVGEEEPPNDPVLVADDEDDDDDVKTVPLNNENDDRIDSIGGGGQGDIASNSSMESNGAITTATIVVVAGAPKDLDQSTMSKGIAAAADDGPTTTPITTSHTIETKVGAVTASGAPAIEPTDKEPTTIMLATENGVEEIENAIESQSEVGEETKASEEENLETIEESETISAQGDSSAAGEPEAIAVTTTAPTEDEEKDIEAAVVVEPRAVAKLADDDLADDEVISGADVESMDAPLMLTEDSQEEEEEEVVLDDDVKVKKEPRSDQLENEIETIDIDTDDDEDEDDLDDEDESIESPPMEGEDEEGEDNEGNGGGRRKVYLSGYDDVEEVDDNDDDEDDAAEEEEEDFDGRPVEMPIGEEFEEAEIEDDDEGDVVAEDELGSELELAEEEANEGDSTEENLDALKEGSRGVKRKMSRETEEGPTAQQQQQELKKRDTKWLTSSSQPSSRMHVMDSVCRDAVIRPKVAEKVTEDPERCDSIEDVDSSPAPAKVATPEAAVKANNDRASKISQRSVTEKEEEEVERLASKDTSAGDGEVQLGTKGITRLEDGQKKVDSLAKEKEEEKTSPSANGKSSLAEGRANAEKLNKEASQEEEKSRPEGRIEDCDKLEKSAEARIVEKPPKEEVAERIAKQETSTTIPETESMDVDSHEEEEEVSEIEAKKPSGKPAIPTESVSATEIRSGVEEPEEPTKPLLPQVPNTSSSNKETSSPIPTSMKRKRSPSPRQSKSTSELPESTKQIPPQESTAPIDPTNDAEAVKRSRLMETATELLQRELEANFGRHDRLLTEYIEKAAAERVGESVEKHVEQLVVEITALNVMIRAKEQEWNNMIYLKKAKEELVVRLTRKRHLEEIEAAPLEKAISVAAAQQAASAGELGQTTTTAPVDSSHGGSKAAAQANLLIQNLQLSSSSLSGVATSKTTQSILQNRANMTTEDLEKERKNTAKLHRHSQGSASSIGPGHRNSVSPSNAGGRASAPAVPMTASASSPAVQPPQSASTPLPGGTSHHNNSSSNTSSQQQISAATIAAFHALQQQDLLNGQQQQQFHQQQMAAAAAAAASQMVGRQGAIKDVRSIIEDYRQRHPEAVPRRGRRMKTVLTTNASLMNAGGDGGGGVGDGSCSSSLPNHSVVDLSGALADGGGGGSVCVGGVITGGVEIVKIESDTIPISRGEAGGGGGSGKVTAATPIIPIAVTAVVNKQKPKDRPRAQAAIKTNVKQSGNNSRRGASLSDWQVMLAAASADTPPPPQPQHQPASLTRTASRTSSAESQHSNSSSSAAAISSILREHGLLTHTSANAALSITSLGGRGDVVTLGGGGGGGGGPAVGNVQHQPASQQQQAQQQAQQLAQASTNSLLHGILTKRHNQQQQQQQPGGRSAQQQQQQLQAQNATNGGAAGANNNPNVSGFSPTLARLLTAPERISTAPSYQPPQNPVMNLSKNMKSEITITPVVSGNSNREQQQHTANQMYNMMLSSLQDDDQDDNSADRLVIDEGIHSNNAVSGGGLLGDTVHGQEFHENEVPECQGCKRREAQFVCAGCGNQWYCSRECQVNAWDEHSETCTG